MKCLTIVLHQESKSFKQHLRTEQNPFFQHPVTEHPRTSNPHFITIQIQTNSTRLYCVISCAMLSWEEQTANKTRTVLSLLGLS